VRGIDEKMHISLVWNLCVSHGTCNTAMIHMVGSAETSKSIESFDSKTSFSSQIDLNNVRDTNVVSW